MPRETVKDVLAENETLRFPPNPGDLYEVEDEKERLDTLDRRNRAAAEHATDFNQR